MTKDELKEKLDGLIAQDDCGMNIFFVLRKQDTFILKKANVRHDALEPLKASLKESIIQMNQQLESDDFSLMNLSVADGRREAMYVYDLEEVPAPVTLMKELDENLFNIDYFTEANNKVFDFSTDSFDEIDAWIASYGVEGNYVITYRKTFSVNLLKQGRNLLLFKDAGQIDLFRNDLLRIDGKMDFFRISDVTIIYNLSILEKFNDFKEIVVRAATDSITRIAAVDLVTDIAKLHERAQTDISFARKLVKVTTNSLVLNVVSKDEIIAFARTHAYLSRRLKISAQDKFELNKKTSQNLFLQLLDDAFLHSELSRNDYLSPGKDILQPEGD